MGRSALTSHVKSAKHKSLVESRHQYKLKNFLEAHEPSATAKEGHVENDNVAIIINADTSTTHVTTPESTPNEINSNPYFEQRSTTRAELL